MNPFYFIADDFTILVAGLLSVSSLQAQDAIAQCPRLNLCARPQFFMDIPRKMVEDSLSIRTRVIKAREIQAERYKDNPGIYCNAQISSKMLKEICIIEVSQNLLKAAMNKLNLSARAYDRILKLAVRLLISPNPAQ